MIWALLIACLLVASLLAGVESALLTVSRVRARHAASEGDAKALRLTALLEQRNDLVQAAIAVNHLLSLIAFLILAANLQRWLGPWGIALAVVVALPVFLIGLELVPKSLFRRYPYRLLKRLLPLLSVLEVIALPWRFFGGRFRRKAVEKEAAAAPGFGLAGLSQSIGHLGLLPPAAASLMQRFATFNSGTAESLMQPLQLVSALPSDLPLTSAAQLVRETRRRYHAVMDADGTFLGCFDAASLPAKLAKDRMVRLFTHPLMRLRAKDKAMHCLQAMRKSGAALALVTDANGQAVGLLTLESLLAWVGPPQG